MQGKIGKLLKNTGWFVTRVWVWLPVTLGILVVIALMALPFAIRQGIERWLTDQGAEQVRIEDIDFNLFIGRLSVRNLQFQADGQRPMVLPHASLRFDRLPLLRRQLVIQDLYLRDTSLAIEQTADGRWRVAHLGRPTKADEPSAWHVMLRNVEITNGALKYTGLGQNGQAEIDHAEITLGSDGTESGVFPITRLQTRINGKVHFSLAKPDMTLEFRLNAEIRAGAPAREASGTWNIDGRAEIQHLDVKWKENDLRIISTDQVNVETLTMSGLGQIMIGSVTVNGLSLAQPMTRESATPLLRVSPLRVSDIRYQSGQSLDIGEISAHGVNLVATHEKRGSWYGLTPLRAFLQAFDANEAKKPALPVRIGTLAIADPARIELSDYAIDPPYRSRLTLNSAMLTNLDTGSPPQQPADIALSARIGKYAQAELHGQIRSYHPKLAASVLIKLREFDMPTLSSYSTQMLGYRVISGQMGGELDLQIADGRLDGKSKLSFAKLAMKPKDDAAAEKLKTRLSVPLETGLAMLRDKNNNVNLEVDISGDTSDPKFGLVDVINQALTKAMRTASVSFLKHYFQPYGTLITVAELAGKVMQLRLDPLVYSAGTATLTPEAGDYLTKIGKLLQERENLGVKLCGKSVPQDGLAEEASRALASRRAENLKELFVSQYGIATDRLFLCEPEIEQDSAAKPRVELLL